MVSVVSEQGTLVVYELVKVTGEGVDTLMVQGQAMKWSVLRWSSFFSGQKWELTQSDGGLRGDGVGCV